MENLKNHTEKLCSFYVSEWHLVTMILPYINKEINEKANITTILQKNIEENIKTLISKLNLKNEKDILKIDWKASEEIEYTKIDKKLMKMIKEKNDNNIIFVSGSKEYIDIINQIIGEWTDNKKDLLQNMKFKIINCYEVTEFNNSIHDILSTHDRVLNTSGEKYIYEVFDGYSDAKEMC